MGDANSSGEQIDSQPKEEVKEVPTTDPLNLRKPFPIAFRSIFRRSILWVLSFIVLVLILMTLDTLRPIEESVLSKIFLLICLLLIVVGMVLIIGKLIYEILYYHVYYYGIELEHVVISRGLIFKTRASFPITHLSDVYLYQTPIDLLFAISNLRVTTTSPVSEFGAIEGLAQHRAIALQNLLLALANTTTDPINMQGATDSLKTMHATDEPSVFDASPAEKDPPRMSSEKIPDIYKEKAEEESNAKPEQKEEGKPKEVENKEKETAPVQSTPIANAKELLNELQQTKHVLEETRDELIHAEELLEKTQTTLENALSTNEQD